MQTYKLVLPEHLNHAGFLFGGNLLKWVDEAAYMAARLDYPACEFVTVAMNQVQFKQRVELGSILLFEVLRTRVGTTSVDYSVNVKKSSGPATGQTVIFSTTATFVHIDSAGQKQPLPKE